MGKHMDDKTKALCYFYRHPPRGSGVKPVPFSKIPNLVRAPGKRPPLTGAVFRAVKNFHTKQAPRGRKVGYRKTTPAEDRTILKSFYQVRQPLGSKVVSRDVWNNLPQELHDKICKRTVAERLREEGYQMDQKIAKDDKGEKWKATRVKFARNNAQKTPERWVSTVQGVGDYRFFTYFPRRLKQRQKRLSCPATIMRKGEKTKTPFLRPKHKMFTTKEYKAVTKVKVFGVTTSDGQVFVCPSPSYPTSSDFVKMVNNKLGPFLRTALPHRTSYKLLLDGETPMHTPEAKAALKANRISLLPDWPAHSPDLNPQENVWGWAEPQLRKTEKQTDSVATFKKRVFAICKQYPGGAKLVPGLAKRMAECIKRQGAPIGK